MKKILGIAFSLALVFTSLSTSSYAASTHTIRITKVECIKTEGFTGSDEIYLKTSNDDYTQYKIGKLNDGESKYPDIDIPFEDHMIIYVYDEDYPDSDDFIGFINVPYDKFSSGYPYTEYIAQYRAQYKITLRMIN